MIKAIKKLLGLPPKAEPERHMFGYTYGVPMHGEIIAEPIIGRGDKHYRVRFNLPFLETNKSELRRLGKLHVELACKRIRQSNEDERRGKEIRSRILTND